MGATGDGQSCRLWYDGAFICLLRCGKSPIRQRLNLTKRMQSGSTSYSFSPEFSRNSSSSWIITFVRNWNLSRFFQFAEASVRSSWWILPSREPLNNFLSIIKLPSTTKQSLLPLRPRTPTKKISINRKSTSSMRKKKKTISRRRLFGWKSKRGFVVGRRPISVWKDSN